ncbi:MAG: hypothetical protein WC649_05405, partial [Desulfobacteria bacterium]
DGTVKSSRCKARKSEGMKRTYLYAAMTEDAAERRRWTFYEAVKKLSNRFLSHIPFFVKNDLDE